MFHRFLVLLAFSALCTANCFWRNGTKNPSPDYKPCSSDTSDPLHTVCCAAWDHCLPNGLCKSTLYTDQYWRETCIFSDWSVGGCQELCSNETSQEGHDIIVTPCDGSSTSTTWCCGDTSGNNDDCCKPGSSEPRYTIAATFGDAVSTSLSSSSYSASSTSASSRTPSSTSNAKQGGGGLSTGAKAGIGVGAAVGGIALIGACIFCFKALGWRRKATGEPYQGQAQAPGWNPPLYGGEMYAHHEPVKPVQLYEAPESPPAELPGHK